jgi:hypothetical protein
MAGLRNLLRQPSSSFNSNTQGCGCGTSSCPDKFGCPPDMCPDFLIKRHDTQPAFKIKLDDCDGPVDLRGLVLEANMWAKARLKKAITDTDTYFRLADDIGFEQAMVGDIIIMNRARLPEHMLVIGFDEKNKLVQVQRGYNATTASSWTRGAKLKIFRMLDSAAVTETILEDVEQVDGTTDNDVLTQSFMVYEWNANDVCLPGCYWLEFKLLKMIDLVLYSPGNKWCGPTHTESGGFFYTGSAMTDSSMLLSYDSVNDEFLLPDPSNVWDGAKHQQVDENYYTGTTHNDGSVILSRTGIPSDENICYTSSGNIVLTTANINTASIIPSFVCSGNVPADYGCTLGVGVEWVRRFPSDSEGFLIKIIDSPTAE